MSCEARLIVLPVVPPLIVASVVKFAPALLETCSSIWSAAVVPTNR